jgi:hypothetical protein
MVKTFTVAADKDALRFDVAENGWTRLTLVGQSEVYLGADIFDRVFSRLIGYLKNEDVLGRPSAGKIEGHSVYCLLLLSEAHHALYVTAPGAESQLFWQNADADPMFIAGVMRPSSAQRQQWIETLSGALEEAKRPALALA